MVILGKTKKCILKELKNLSLHGYEIAKRLNIPLTGIYQHLKDLSEDGLIVSQQVGRRKIYSLTSKGEVLLSILENNNKDSS